MCSPSQRSIVKNNKNRECKGSKKKVDLSKNLRTKRHKIKRGKRGGEKKAVCSFELKYSEGMNTNMLFKFKK